MIVPYLGNSISAAYAGFALVIELHAARHAACEDYLALGALGEAEGWKEGFHHPPGAGDIYVKTGHGQHCCIHVLSVTRNEGHGRWFNKKVGRDSLILPRALIEIQNRLSNAHAGVDEEDVNWGAGELFSCCSHRLRLIEIEEHARRVGEFEVAIGGLSNCSNYMCVWVGCERGDQATADASRGAYDEDIGCG
jgi:hypothetical protein